MTTFLEFAFVAEYDEPTFIPAPLLLPLLPPVRVEVKNLLTFYVKSGKFFTSTLTCGRSGKSRGAGMNVGSSYSAAKANSRTVVTPQ